MVIPAVVWGTNKWQTPFIAPISRSNRLTDAVTSTISRGPAVSTLILCIASRNWAGLPHGVGGFKVDSATDRLTKPNEQQLRIRPPHRRRRARVDDLGLAPIARRKVVPVLLPYERPSRAAK